jgi:hypothetical protein
LLKEKGEKYPYRSSPLFFKEKVEEKVFYMFSPLSFKKERGRG